MNRNSTIFLQTVIVLIGTGALVFMLWEPHVEGRNAHATLFEIYFKDPFLAYAYFSSIPFFVVLYQTFKLLGYIKRNEVFSQRSVKGLRAIKKCGVMMIGLVCVGVFWIMLDNSDDDRAGGIAMGMVITFASLIITAAADVFERLLQSALDIQIKIRPVI